MKLPTLSSILSILVVFSIPQAVQSKETSTAKEVGIGFAIVRAVRLAAGEIVSAVNSWFETSNAALIADGQGVLDQFEVVYFPVAQKISRYFNVPNLVALSNWQEEMPNEDLLCDIALYIDKAKGVKSWDTVCSEAWSFLNNAADHKNMISIRILKITAQKKVGAKEQQELAELRNLEAKLGFISGEMNVMYQYICLNHADYLKMALWEWKLSRKYAYEISLLDGSIRTALYLDQAISEFISQDIDSEFSRYAYMLYCRHLNSDIDFLRSIRDRVAYDRYPERCAWTDRMVATLDQLANIVRPWYLYGYEEYQKQEEERRRYEFEREKIRFLREQNKVDMSTNNKVIDRPSLSDTI